MVNEDCAATDNPLFWHNKMSEALLKEIALQVVQQGLLSNWRFYAILLPLIFISGAAGAYLGKYFGKRGELYATKADFDEILRQLAKTTEVAEQVRSAVSHADWAAREWKTIRRIKLEELVQCAISVDEWLDYKLSALSDIVNQYYIQVSNERILDSKKISRYPLEAQRVYMISSLYFSDFPELSKQCEKLRIEALKAALLLTNKTKENVENKQNNILCTNDYQQQRTIVCSCIEEILNQSEKIMDEFCNPHSL